MFVTHKQVSISFAWLLLLLTTASHATTVYHSDGVDEIGNPLDMYLVLDNGNATGVYFDYTVADHGEFAIDPNDLLSGSPSQVAMSSLYDIYSVGTVTGTVIVTDNRNVVINDLEFGYLQNNRPLILDYVTCMLIVDCSVGIWYNAPNSSAGLIDLYIDDLSWIEVATNEVPMPAAVWLFGSGLIGLIGVARRKKA